jgi:23S rRNA (cytidine1920-2'-O)/16S rRNA (cytidine1409-2'-O)-methyltransferase
MGAARRLDISMVERGLAESRSMAQRMVMAGSVRVDGQVVLKASRRVRPEATITVDKGPRFVSRGGEKLEAALVAFSISVEGRVCADIGSSTGGFTDCLLQRGAAKVYAVDVGHGILHWNLRNDPRVVVMERTNARFLRSMPEPIDLVTVDVSFISLSHIIPQAGGWLKPDGDVVALIKPQFEAGRGRVGKGGVVRDADLHRQIVLDVIRTCSEAGLPAQGVMRSPLVGPKGNVEFLVWCHRRTEPPDASEMVESFALAPSG